jgi:two-component system OmpR family sensor kinase
MIVVTAEGTIIEVSTNADRDQLRIDIRDHGPAAPEDQLETIFEPFSRAHSDTILPGHGLGLAITKRAVERHGGKVGAERHPREGWSLTCALRDGMMMEVTPASRDRET